jgi:hypothetical protein
MIYYELEQNDICTINFQFPLKKTINFQSILKKLNNILKSKREGENNLI